MTDKEMAGIIGAWIRETFPESLSRVNDLNMAVIALCIGVIARILTGEKGQKQ